MSYKEYIEKTGDLHEEKEYRDAYGDDNDHIRCDRIYGSSVCIR